MKLFLRRCCFLILSAFRESREYFCPPNHVISYIRIALFFDPFVNFLSFYSCKIKQLGREKEDNYIFDEFPSRTVHFGSEFRSAHVLHPITNSIVTQITVLSIFYYCTRKFFPCFIAGLIRTSCPLTLEEFKYYSTLSGQCSVKHW